MCGRFTLRSSPQAVAEAFALPDVPELFPHFNIAPSQPVAVVRQQPGADARELTFLRWGLIPAWAADPSIGDRLANARSETAATKPSFRRAFRSRCCLVVADGFYEWRRADGAQAAVLRRPPGGPALRPGRSPGPVAPLQHRPRPAGGRGAATATGRGPGACPPALGPGPIPCAAASGERRSWAGRSAGSCP